MIYLDNSATTWPKPLPVRRAVQQGLTELGANPGRSGYDMSMRTSRAVYECRRTAAELFGAAGPECVIFQPSCTQALNLVLKGVLQAGDHVVVTDLEHNAVMRPLEALKERGVSWTAAEVFPGENDRTLESFRRAITPKTKLAVCTGGSNVFGVRVPVGRIGALCRQYGAKLCVDAAQTAGVIPIRMREDCIDYLCCAGHKGLYGPMGTGLLIFGDPADRLRTLVEGGTGTRSKSRVQPEESPERYESGTLNVPGILGLKAGMEFVRARGVENIYLAEMKKLGYFYDRLKAIPGVKLYTPRPEPPAYLPVLAFNVEGFSSEETGERLAGAGVAVRCGLHCAPTAHEKLGTPEGAVRVSPSLFTRSEELNAAAAAVRRIAASRRSAAKRVELQP